jgi:hypothetical protein
MVPRFGNVPGQLIQRMSVFGHVDFWVRDGQCASGDFVFRRLRSFWSAA